MMKLYILYLLLGCFLFMEGIAIYTFSFYGVAAITYMALMASFLLCPMASALSLFDIRLSLIAGFTGLICFLPFGNYWLVYRYQNEDFTTWSTENGCICIEIILYITSLVYTIKGLINYKLQNNLIIKKPLKLILACVLAILFVMQVYCFF